MRQKGYSLDEERRSQDDSDSALAGGVSEHVQIDERLILAPAHGRFHKRNGDNPVVQGTYLVEGHLVGDVMTPGGDLVPIPTSFCGWVMGFLVEEGWPVKRSEPVIWLRHA
jgi:hypothetical protein